MASDKTLRRGYYDRVNTEVAKYEGDKKMFYDLVNKQISEVFEQAYIKRLGKVYDKSKEA